MHEQSGKDLAHQVGAQFGGLFGLGAGLAKDMAKDVGVVSKGDDKAAQAAKEAAVANRVERVWLFHGTDEDTVPKITSMGFNRSFCGKNATMFGKGVSHVAAARTRATSPAGAASANLLFGPLLTLLSLLTLLTLLTR